MNKTFFLFLLIEISLFHFQTKAQNPQDIANKGFDLIDKKEYAKAIEVFKDLIEQTPSNYGGYNFVGICYSQSEEHDSTIYYLLKSIELNSANFKNSKEMTISRLIRTYMQKYDFKSAFELAYISCKEFPENPILKSDLRDICLWSYNINFEKLDKTYINNTPKEEYKVTAVSQEYLIMRNLRINDLKLNLIKQVFDSENKADILTCAYNKNSDTIRLKFKINWDMNSEFGGKFYSNSKKEFKNIQNNIFDRIGAKLIDEPKLELLTEIEKILKK